MRTERQLDELHRQAIQGRRWYVCEYRPTRPGEIGRAVFEAPSDEAALGLAARNGMAHPVIREVSAALVVEWERWAYGERLEPERGRRLGGLWLP